MDLRDLCALEGYELVIDSDPQGRPDALGDTSQDRIGKAQLCKNRIIAIREDTPDATYCVSHELAHGRAGFSDEKDVLVEQAYIVTGWVRALLREMREIREHEKERLGRRDSREDAGRVHRAP